MMRQSYRTVRLFVWDSRNHWFQDEIKILGPDSVNEGPGKARVDRVV